MGIFAVELEVSTGNGPRHRLELMVDSGAFYSVLPAAVWRALGLQSTRELDFCLVDGTIITRGVSECRFHYAGIAASSPVILGGPDDVAILGAVTLETMGLVLNPLERTLRPARLRLGTLGPAFASAAL